MKTRVLVTGAGGYIGRHIVQQLEQLETVEVIACDLYPTEVSSGTIMLTKDIFSGSAHIFEELLSPDICIHLAWKDGFKHNSDAHMEQLSNHYKFFNHMLSGGLKSLSVMGTMHEVGYYEGAITEDTPCNPSSMYGIAKDALRRSLFLLGENYKDITLHWLRAFYIYGDDEKNSSIFAKILMANKGNKKKFPFTTGKNKYDFIHVRELAKQIALASLQNQVDGIINCCSGVPVSLADRVNGFIKEHNLEIELEYGAFPDRSYDSPEVWGDASKIEKILQAAKGNVLLR